jgi:hypothetical protein
MNKEGKMTIESDEILKKALKVKLSKIIDEIPVTLESLTITSDNERFMLHWKKAKEEP